MSLSVLKLKPLSISRLSGFFFRHTICSSIFTKDATGSLSTLAGLGAFFMDRNLDKYRFGRTLELYPSCYRIFLIALYNKEFQTTCQYAMNYVLSNSAIPTFVKANSWQAGNGRRYDSNYSAFTTYGSLTQHICIPI